MTMYVFPSPSWETHHSSLSFLFELELLSAIHAHEGHVCLLFSFMRDTSFLVFGLSFLA
jgi:hypothetical protein